MIRSERYGFFMIFHENRQVGRGRSLLCLPQGDRHNADLFPITLNICTKNKFLENQGLIVLLFSGSPFCEKAIKAEFHPTF